MTNQMEKIINQLTSKEHAIKELCKTANMNCLAIHELWCYKEIAAHFGITRGDYYNDYDALTEEDKKHIGDNWKIASEDPKERLEQLLNDLRRESGGFKYFERDVYREDLGKAWFKSTLNHYEWHAKMLHELITAVKELYPADSPESER